MSGTRSVVDLVGLCAAVLVLPGCGPRPYDTIEKFVDSYNRKDINSVVSCLDPAIEKAYLATSNILATFIGVQIQDVADLFPALFQIMQGHSDDKTDYTLGVKELSTTIDDELAVVEVELTENFTNRSGDVTSNTVRTKFHLKMFDDEWRIVDAR